MSISPRGNDFLVNIGLEGRKEIVPRLSLPSEKSPRSIRLRSHSGRVSDTDKKITNAAEPYTLKACCKDAKGLGSWVIWNRSFPSDVIEEMGLLLNGTLIQDENLDLTKVQSKKTTLALAECLITPQLIAKVLNSGLKTLHIQQSILENGSAEAFKCHLKNSHLNTLIFWGMKISPLELQLIVDGLIEQNANSTGVKELFITASLIDSTHSKVLRQLFGEGLHLKKIDLANNMIGSKYQTKILSSIAEDKDKDKDKENSEPLRAFPQQANISKSAVRMLIKGALENARNGGKLKLVVLADDGLNQGDRELLVDYKNQYYKLKEELKAENVDSAHQDTYGIDENSGIVCFNLNNNGFKEEDKDEHLCNYSPRNMPLGGTTPWPTRRRLSNDLNRSNPSISRENSISGSGL